MQPTSMKCTYFSLPLRKRVGVKNKIAAPILFMFSVVINISIQSLFYMQSNTAISHARPTSAVFVVSGQNSYESHRESE